MAEEKMNQHSLSNDYSYIETLLAKFGGSYTKTVSIVIPHYNNLGILEKTLASLTLQTYPRGLIEVVVSDDGSDKNPNYLSTLFKPYFPIQVLSHERSGHRVATARNRGIEASSGEIILSIDSDIICPPRAIEEHLKWFHVASNIATIGLRRFVDTSKLTVNDIFENIEFALNLPDIKSISNTNPTGLSDKRLREFEFFKQHPFPCNCFHGCNVAYGRDQAFQVGLWNEAFNGNPNYEDIEFGHRLWKAGVFLIYVDSAVVLHQENAVTSLQDKISNGAINRELLFSKVPGLREFRANLAFGAPNSGGNSLLGQTGL